MPSATPSRNYSSRAIILGTTIVLGAVAIALIFAPDEVARSAGLTQGGPVTLVLQLYGAALFGLAMIGWMVKDSIIGGVFGRSYVVGSAAHAFVGALALVRLTLGHGAPPIVRVLACAYVALAIIFAYLMFVATPQS